MRDEVEARRQKLLRVIDQGAKLEQLYSQEDFQFFMGWIERLREDLAKTILRGRETVDKKDWHCRGGYDYLTKVIEAAEEFKDKATRARKALDKFDKAVREASGRQ